jgi:hypothetical protein
MDNVERTILLQEAAQLSEPAEPASIVRKLVDRDSEPPRLGLVRVRLFDHQQQFVLERRPHVSPQDVHQPSLDTA